VLDFFQNQSIINSVRGREKVLPRVKKILKKDEKTLDKTLNF
jgi:hypothetical protein